MLRMTHTVAGRIDPETARHRRECAGRAYGCAVIGISVAPRSD